MKSSADVSYRIGSLGGASASSFYSNAHGSHSTGAGTSNPPAGPCNLITRFDGWEVIIPLQFIPMEDI